MASGPAGMPAAMSGSVATDQAEVLAAMLRIAEGEIRGKEEQHALLQQIIATNEKELAAKDRRIDELEGHMRTLTRELEEFKRLFDRYLTKAENARGASVYQPRRKARIAAWVRSLTLSFFKIEVM